ncbi:MAG: zinc-ribbon domain-containing protein [Dehalococcoidia bacterium]|nr:zinc-ribbon domain-containing protein [Dehalococcoidia bacterium]
MFCRKCGQQISDDATFCPSCGSQQASGNSVAKSDPGLLKALVVTGGGAILTLIALAPDWLSLRCAGDECDGGSIALDAFGSVKSELMRLFSDWDPMWIGCGLPTVLMILCAVVGIGSVAYAFFTGVPKRKLWLLAGLLSLICIIANFGYLEGYALTWDPSSGYRYDDDSYTIYATPHAGWILALLGAVTMIVGSRMGRSGN